MENSTNCLCTHFLTCISTRSVRASLLALPGGSVSPKIDLSLHYFVICQLNEKIYSNLIIFSIICFNLLIKMKPNVYTVDRPQSFESKTEDKIIALAMFYRLC